LERVYHLLNQVGDRKFFDLVVQVLIACNIEDRSQLWNMDGKMGARAFHVSSYSVHSASLTMQDVVAGVGDECEQAEPVTDNKDVCIMCFLCADGKLTPPPYVVYPAGSTDKSKNSTLVDQRIPEFEQNWPDDWPCMPSVKGFQVVEHYIAATKHWEELTR